MIVLKEGKGHAFEVDCALCNTRIGLNMSDIESYTFDGEEYKYYTICPKCGIRFNINKNKVPYEVKETIEYYRLKRSY